MSSKTLGLALGGGAARGLSHIVVLEVLDDLGVKPAFIAGASIGALIGSAYASGLCAVDIREHTLSVLGNPRTAARRIFMDLESGLGNLVSIAPSRPVLLNGLGLVRLVTPKGVAKRIEQTAIPFVVCATDFYEASEVVLDSGDLESAVAASISIPGIIQAPALDGRLLIDGGFCNPVPINHVRARKCAIVMGVNVTGRPVRKPKNVHAGRAELLLGAIQISHQQITRLQCERVKPDIMVVPDINRFGAHDFFKVRDILAAAQSLREPLKRQLAALLSA